MNRVRRTGTFVTAASLLLAVCGLAQGAEIIVPTQMSLSVALASAVDGDTITILPSGSPYSQYPGFSFTGKHLHIRGSTGNPADVVIDGANLDRVLSISTAAADGSTIEALTLQHGRGPNVSEGTGAGLYINDSNVTIKNCIIKDNVQPGADGNGAGIYAFGGSVLTVQNTVISGNTTTGGNGDGAGVFLTTASAVFENCQFINNIAEATLSDDNSWGGALYLDNGTFRFTRCLINGNKAELGGAIGASGTAAVTMDACRIEANFARWGGGLYIAAGAAVPNIFRNCLLLSNQSVYNGCAAEINKAANFMNCTFANNYAGLNWIVNCNAASRSVLTMDNCIFWGNSMAQGIAPITGTNAPILRRCLVQVAYTVNNGSANNTVADPKFAGINDYHLQMGSPGIDAGDTTLYSGPLADYDGNSRGVDSAAPDTGYTYFGPVIDIGAYEFGTTCYANCDESSVAPILNVNDFQCFINKFAAGCP